MATKQPLPFDPVGEARRQWEDHGWDDAALGMAAVTSVMRVQQLLLAAVDDVLEPFGLTFARYEVLALLWFSRNGELPLGKIGARLQVHPASVTNAVDRLAQSGLVVRKPHPTDGRAVLAVITAAGRQRVSGATAALNQVFTTLPVSDGDLAEVVTLLERFRAAAGDFEQK